MSCLSFLKRSSMQLSNSLLVDPILAALTRSRAKRDLGLASTDLLVVGRSPTLSHTSRLHFQGRRQNIKSWERQLGRAGNTRALYKP